MIKLNRLLYLLTCFALVSCGKPIVKDRFGAEVPTVSHADNSGSAYCDKKPTKEDVIRCFQIEIHRKIARHWDTPKYSQGLKSEIRLFVDLRGDILKIEFIAHSGDTFFDESVLNALELANPLPISTNRTLYEEAFEEIVLVFTPPS